MSPLATNLPEQRRMLDVLRAGLRASENVALCTSFLRFSGLQLVIDDLQRFTSAGGRARILTSTYLGITQPEAIRVLADLDGVTVRLHVAQRKGALGFHPKFVVFHGNDSSCWVGSSNLSKGGLTTNVEANLGHRDAGIVAQVLDTFDALWDGNDVFPLDGTLVDLYAEARKGSAAHRETPLAITWPLSTADSDAKPEPNEAQRDALVSLERLRRTGESRAVVIAAPGIGKTFLSAFDAHRSGAQTVLFLSHRLEHLTQAKRTFELVFGPRATTSVVAGGGKDTTADLVFATVQSSSSTDTLEGRHFDYVVVDEFHHAAAPSYQALLKSIAPKFLLGLTATPERQDGHDVLRICDFNIAYEVRLIEAINRGWLVPFHYFGISDDTVDYRESFWRNRRFDPTKMENALMLEARVDHILEHALAKGYDGARRATVGFCAGRRHARFMANALRARGLVAVAVTGEDSIERRLGVYESLANPDDPLEWLFVADILNEGVDIPAINSLLFLRPTDSATVFLQQLGRGLRLSPGCEVLTAIDFVGHHRNAWLALEALQDGRAPKGSSTVTGLQITPPRNCEIVLDDRTLEVLAKVERFTRRKKDLCIEAYERLREEVGPPFPVDLIGADDVPPLSDFRTAFRSWLDLRVAMDDATPWELAIKPGSPAYNLLIAAERDWQQQRVYAYALFWGLCKNADDPVAGYEAFFDRFPIWRVEYAPLQNTKVWVSLSKNLGPLLNGQELLAAARNAFPGEKLAEHIENRLRYVLDRDYRMRHGGVLRTPKDLELHREYRRPEIVNHFGLQYDPARHNLGVLNFGSTDPNPNDVVLIAKIDTTDAKGEFQYSNRFSAPDIFNWQSQNRQRQNNAVGRRILDHRQLGLNLHLFVQARSHENPVYVGLADVDSVDGNAPMNVTFKLRRPVPKAVLESLSNVDGSST